MKKFVAIVLSIVCVLACFAACGTTENTENNKKTDTTETTETTDTTENKKTLVMGTNANFPPYELTDDNGDIIGIDAEIAQAIADKLGMTLEIKDMEFDSLLTAVQAGSVDIVLAGLTVTDERKESVNFTDSYAKGVQAIVVKEGSEIASADDLNGHKIGVQSGTTGDIYCTGDFGAENVNQYTNGPLAIQALLNDQVDCVVIDNEPAKSFVAANTGLKVLETAYTEEDYAAAISKDNTELLENVNKALAELTADGTIQKIIDKYITAE